jgi:hypothetical protein
MGVLVSFFCGQSKGDKVLVNDEWFVVVLVFDVRHKGFKSVKSGFAFRRDYRRLHPYWSFSPAPVQWQ